MHKHKTMSENRNKRADSKIQSGSQSIQIQVEQRFLNSPRFVSCDSRREMCHYSRNPLNGLVNPTDTHACGAISNILFSFRKTNQNDTFWNNRTDKIEEKNGKEMNIFEKMNITRFFTCFCCPLKPNRNISFCFPGVGTRMIHRY